MRAKNVRRRCSTPVIRLMSRPFRPKHIKKREQPGNMDPDSNLVLLNPDFLGPDPDLGKSEPDHKPEIGQQQAKDVSL